MRTKVQHVVADAGQFREQHAQILGAQRHVDIEQLFNRQHIAVLHAQRRAIIEPIKIGQRLQIGLILNQLFGTAMQQADMRIEPLHNLPV